MKIKNSRQYSVNSKQERIKNLSTVCCLRSANQKGVTLIELVITMVLMGIVAVVVANALSTGIQGNLVTDNRKEALDQARVAMERMRREIRNLDNKAVAAVISSATQFCFTNTESTLINYSLQGANIKRKEAGLVACPVGEGETLSTNIDSFLFEYIRANGTVDAAYAAGTTKRIRITLTAKISGESVQLQTEVWPRNL